MHSLKAKSGERGVGMMDILISIAVITIAFWGFSQIALLGVKVQREAEQREGAAYLAQEAIEVVRLLRDGSWSANIAPLITGIPYFPAVSGTAWVLSAADPGFVDGMYTRKVIFERVYRDDASDNISPTGTEDVNSRKVIVKVAWGDKEYELVTYLTNFLFN